MVQPFLLSPNSNKLTLQVAGLVNTLVHLPCQRYSFVVV